MELHNQIVELLKELPNIHDNAERRALIYSASLDKELEDQINFEGTSDQFCQILVRTLARYGTLEQGRHALIAVLEVTKKKVGQEGQALCKKLVQQVQATQPHVFEMLVDQIDTPIEPKIDIHLKKIREVDEVIGVETDEAPEGSTKVTIEDIKKGKKVTGMAIKKV